MIYMINKESRLIRQKVRKDIKQEMNSRGLLFADCTMVAAIDYVCMVNDIEFNGAYGYTGNDWVRDTMFNYPNCFTSCI